MAAIMEIKKMLNNNRAKRNLFLLFITAVFGWLTVITPVQAAPSGDPVSLLKYIADNMIDGLKSNKATLKTKPSIVYNLAYKYVVPYASLNEMSKRVLPPRIWNSASESQKQQFQKLFTKTVKLSTIC